LAVFGTALVAVPCEKARAEASNAHLVIRGRVLVASYAPLPEKPGEINLNSLWTYRLRVLRVIQGTERRREVVARAVSDPQIRNDKDFTFELIPQQDGTYEIKNLR
jgi:hypothetical protein